VIKVDKSVRRPQSLLHFVPGDEPSGLLKQNEKDLEWLALQGGLVTVFSQFRGFQVKDELAKADLMGGWTRQCHRTSKLCRSLAPTLAHSHRNTPSLQSQEDKPLAQGCKCHTAGILRELTKAIDELQSAPDRSFHFEARQQEVFIGRAKITICVLLMIAVGVWPAEELSSITSKQYRISFQYHNGLIYIAAVVNKHHATLILDTGAGTTAFSNKIAPPCPADAMMRLDLARGSMFAFHFPVEFTLGDQNRRDGSYSFSRDVIVGDFRFDAAEGVIGLDVLRSFKLATIDFKDSVLILEDR